VFKRKNVYYDRHFHKYWARSPFKLGTYGMVSLLLRIAEQTVPVEYFSPTAPYQRMIRVFVLLLLSTTSSRCLEAGYKCCVSDVSFIPFDARTPCVTDVSLNFAVWHNRVLDGWRWWWAVDRAASVADSSHLQRVKSKKNFVPRRTSCYGRRRKDRTLLISRGNILLSENKRRKSFVIRQSKMQIYA